MMVPIRPRTNRVSLIEGASDHHADAMSGWSCAASLACGRTLTYDLFGDEFTLLRLGKKPTAATAFVQAASRLGVPLSVVDVAIEDARELYEADLALIRPDQIVAWRGGSVDDAMSVLRRTSGRDFFGV